MNKSQYKNFIIQHTFSLEEVNSLSLEVKTREAELQHCIPNGTFGTRTKQND